MNNTTATATPKKYNDIKKTSIQFKLSKPPGRVFPFYPPTEMIPAESEIFFIPTDKNGRPDEENATNRLIRYVPGMSSIYVDEWSDANKEKRGKAIRFINGFKAVSVREKTLLEFLRLAGFNQANNETRVHGQALIMEVDYENEYKKAVEKDNQTINAQYFVNNMPLDEVTAYAMALCKTTAELDIVRGDEEYAIRHKLKAMAIKNPALFTKGLSDPQMKNRVFIIRAIQKGIITSNASNTELAWDNGETFVESPQGMEVNAHFADLATKNEKYTDIMDAIKDLLDENEKQPKVAEVADWRDSFVAEAIDSGIIIQSANWFMIPSLKEDEDPVIRINGINNLKKALSSNEDNVMSIISERR